MHFLLSGNFFAVVGFLPCDSQSGLDPWTNDHSSGCSTLFSSHLKLNVRELTFLLIFKVKVFFVCVCVNLYFFIFGCAGSSLLPGLFSSCGGGRLLSSCGVQASHCSGLSCGAQAVGRAGFSGRGPQAPEHRLQSLRHTGLGAPRLVRSSRTRERTRVSPTLAGRFFTPEPPGRPQN